MTVEEIVRELRQIVYKPSLASVCRQAGINRETAYRAVRTGVVSERIRASLERAMQGAASRRG